MLCNSTPSVEAYMQQGDPSFDLLIIVTIMESLCTLLEPFGRNVMSQLTRNGQYWDFELPELILKTQRTVLKG